MTTSYSSRLGTAPEEAVKAPCAAVALTNITLSGEQTVNGVAVVAGDRVLVTAQTDTTEHGIYDVAATAWTRATDWNDSEDVVTGQLIPTPQALYEATYSGSFVPGTTVVSFTGLEVDGGVAKLPLAGGQMTGNITMVSTQTVDGRDLSVDGTKLDTIETSATADQTAAEIRTLVEAATDSNVFTDADHTELNTAKLPLAGGQMTGNITMVSTQTVDGRDLSVDGVKVDDIISIRDYATVTGDGVTDDTSALNTVISTLSAAVSQSVLIEIPQGYDIACAQLIMKANVGFICTGGTFTFNGSAGEAIFESLDTEIPSYAHLLNMSVDAGIGGVVSFHCYHSSVMTFPSVTSNSSTSTLFSFVADNTAGSSASPTGSYNTASNHIGKINHNGTCGTGLYLRGQAQTFEDDSRHFETGTIGNWTTSANATLISSASSGLLTVDVNGSQYMNLEVPHLLVGRTYTVQFDYDTDNITGDITLQVGDSVNSANRASLAISSIAQDIELEFVATATTHHISIKTDAGALATESIVVDAFYCSQPPRVVTLNTFESIVFAQCAIRGFDFVDYVDNNTFTGANRCNINANNAVGVEFGSNTGVRGVYSNKFYTLAIDAFDAFTGRVQVKHTIGRYNTVELFADNGGQTGGDEATSFEIVDAGSPSYQFTHSGKNTHTTRVYEKGITKIGTFKAEGNSGQVTSGTSVLDITYSTSVYDYGINEGTNLTIASGRFTSPVRGLYHFNFMGLVQPSVAGDTFSLRLQARSPADVDSIITQKVIVAHSSTDKQSIDISGTMRVNTDSRMYVTIQRRSGTGTLTFTGSDGNIHVFEGHLISGWI